jgi:triacylglycerol esterase/lipase EstA (alpha/beta hydrolase family)
VQQRAEALAAQVAARFPNGKVHIIAHSMAGLDARYLLSHNLQSLANPGRVASLSTVATPHCGSPVADLLVGARPEPEDPRRFLLLPLHAYIESRGRTADEKTNDGLVSVASAKWPGELVEPPWPTDHVGEAGHSLNIGGKLKFDHVAAFDRVVQRIASAS